MSSSTKIYKFGFIADVKTVTLALKFPCIVSVFWKRGEKTAEIKDRKQIEKGVCTFNEKLQIECNMNFDTRKQIFEEKKTKFTVVIFSDKGTKQAGQVYVDVAELLNKKNKKMLIESNLYKSHDKNAKLTIQLSGYMKQQISIDAISQKSNKSINQIQAPVPSANQPDFKKKRQQPTVIEGNKIQKVEQKSSKQIKTQIAPAISITKENIPRVQLLALQEENKKLKNDLRTLRDLQIQNETLKRQYESGQKKACEYYSNKYDQIKLQYTEIKEKLQKLRGLQKTKQNLQRELYENKDKMAAILNYAVLNKMNQFAEELTNIYSSQV